MTAKYWHQVDPTASILLFPIPAGEKLCGVKFMVSGCARHVFLPMILIISMQKKFFI